MNISHSKFLHDGCKFLSFKGKNNLTSEHLHQKQNIILILHNQEKDLY